MVKLSPRFIFFSRAQKFLFKTEQHGRMENYIEIDEYVMRCGGGRNYSGKGSFSDFVAGWYVEYANII